MDHDHFISGPSSGGAQGRTNIAELVPKVVRRIFRVGNRPYGGTADYADFLNANGKVLLPTLFDNNEWHNTLIANRPLMLACVNEFVAAMQGKVNAVEFVNELGGGGGQYAADHAVGAVYWDRIREVAPIFRNAGMELLLSGPPTGSNKDVALLSRAAQENIWSHVDGFVLHPYHGTAGSAASPLSTSNPGGGSQLGWTWRRRKQVDGQFTFTGNTTSGSPTIQNATSLNEVTVGDRITGSGIPASTTVLAKDATALTLTLSNNATATATGVTLTIAAGTGAAGKNMWITEFGWVTRQPDPGGPANLYVTEPNFTTRITQSFGNWATHAEELKLRAACWFSWADWSQVGTGDTNTNSFRYSGIRTNEVLPQNPAPWRYKNGGGQTGATGAKAALDAFGQGTVGTGSAPVAVTGAASPVTQTTATLTGSVDPNSLLTSWYYEYSTEPLP